MKKIFLLFALAPLFMQIQAQTVPNAGLETWRSYSSAGANNLEAPDSWYGIDSLLYLYSSLGLNAQKVLYKESSSVVSGSAAARLATKDVGSGLAAPGILVNAEPVFDLSGFMSNPTAPITNYLSYNGGMAVTQRIYNLSAMIKYTPGNGAGSDFGVMSINAIKTGFGFGGADSVIGKGVLFIPTSSSYTLQSVNVTYTDATTTPDLVVISFISSDFTGENGISPQIGSEMFVDDITLSTVAAVNALYKMVDFATIFPIPAQSVLNIESEAQEASLSIYSMEGKLLLQKVFSNNISIPTGNWANGTYFFEIKDEKNLMVQKGKFNILK